MSELDLSKYDGHTKGPWKATGHIHGCAIVHAAAAAPGWNNDPGPHMNGAAMSLAEDAPILLAEVKQLRPARQAWAIKAAEESARADAAEAVLDEARREGAERERWECHLIAASESDYCGAGSEDFCQRCGSHIADAISARGPMRGPEEE